MKKSIWIGYDPRESEAFAVCRRSLRKHAAGIPIHAIALSELVDAGLYTRSTSRRKDAETGALKLFDDISGHPMSTEFAISRFMTPMLAHEGLALFMDCDVLALEDVWPMFQYVESLHPDQRAAVYCVQHDYMPANETKMDGQAQSKYNRKNWSSVMLFNCDHPANKRLTLDSINTLPGRELHAFAWLRDDEIGALDPAYNYLVGITQGCEHPILVHYTNGGPWFKGYEDCEYATEWLIERDSWLAEDRHVVGRPTTWGPAPHLQLRERIREGINASHLA